MTTFVREDAAQKLIDLGCNSADISASFLERRLIEAARSSLKQSLPVVETTLEAWLLWMSATYGVRLVDQSGNQVHFQ